jgi:transcriptional regulator with XRE-family HTH domain
MTYSDMLTNILPTGLPSVEEVNWLDREFPDPADQRQYAQERCIVAVTEALGAAMEKANINRAELAQRLGVTKGHVSQLFSGRNLTLRSIADVLWACNLEVHDLQLAPLGIMMVPVDQATEWKREQVPAAAADAKASIEVNLNIESHYSPQARCLDMYSQVNPEESKSVEEAPQQVPPKSPAVAANSNLALAA